MVSWKVLKALYSFSTYIQMARVLNKGLLVVALVAMRMPYALHGVNGLWLSSLFYLLIKVVSSFRQSHDTIMSVKIILSQNLLIVTKSV
jgi:hypothetical protein